MPAAPVTAKDLLNENQMFYAALWWAAQLPGGAEQVPAILARHDKAPVMFPPFTPKRGREEINPFEMSDEKIEQLEEWERTGYNPADAVLDGPVIDEFFETLLAAMRSTEKLEYTSSGGHRYLDLRQSIGTASNHPAYPDRPFSVTIEAAIAVAGIHRHALPQNASCYLHNDGQLFVSRDKDSGYGRVSVDYPGRPALPYRTLVLEPADMDHYPVLTWESLYRVVPLRPGQTYKYGWMTVAGERAEFEDTSRGAQALIIGNNDAGSTEALTRLTDEEIIAFHPSLRGSHATWQPEEYRPGYKSAFNNSFVEATADPRIVRSLIPGIAFMKAAEPVQFGCGSDFNVAQAGDFIIRESARSLPRVIAREMTENGRVRFILPPTGPTAPKPRMN